MKLGQGWIVKRGLANDFTARSSQCGSRHRFLITWIALWQALAVGEPEWFCSTTPCFPHTHVLAGLFCHLSYLLQREQDRAIPAKEEQGCPPIEHHFCIHIPQGILDLQVQKFFN